MSNHIRSRASTITIVNSVLFEAVGLGRRQDREILDKDVKREQMTHEVT